MKFGNSFANRCSFGVVRDTSTLDTLYPLGSGRTLAWVVKEAGRPVGWAAGLNTQMRDHKYFGNLRVGTVLDCVAAPEAAGSVAWLSARMLARAGADVVLTNQQHLLWRNAFRHAGFFPVRQTIFLLFRSACLRKLRKAAGTMRSTSRAVTVTAVFTCSSASTRSAVPRFCPQPFCLQPRPLAPC